MALSFMTMYYHLYSHIAHFMRYNRRKWKPVIGCNGLAQYHSVLVRLRALSDRSAVALDTGIVNNTCSMLYIERDIYLWLLP